jgi:hypothetical protein
VLRNPYIVGVERFEAPFSASAQAGEVFHRKEQAARFCLLLWRQFQPELRTIRYTISGDDLADTTVEFAGQPRYDELITLDANDARQIDIEFISQQPTPTGKDLHPAFKGKDEHFPAFLEVFIPLSQNHPQSETPALEYFAEDHLVIWCRPNLLSKVTALWERAAVAPFNRPE